MAQSSAGTHLPPYRRHFCLGLAMPSTSGDRSVKHSNHDVARVAFSSLLVLDRCNENNLLVTDWSVYWCLFVTL